MEKIIINCENRNFIRIKDNPLLIFTIFVTSTFFIHNAFAAAEGTSGCGMFEIREYCESDLEQ